MLMTWKKGETPKNVLGMPSKKKKTYLRTLSQLGLTPPLHSQFGTSTIGTFELGFGPPPTYQNLGRIDKNFS